MKKTNAMRILDSKKIAYETLSYEDDGEHELSRGAAERTVSLGELFDAAVDSRGDAEARRVEPLCDSVSLREGKTIQLRLFRNGKTFATGRLDRLGDQPAFVVECLTEGR